MALHSGDGNCVPPTEVTLGYAPGTSTYRPERPPRSEAPQSAAPLSPDAAVWVMPIRLPAVPSISVTSASLGRIPASQPP